MDLAGFQEHFLAGVFPPPARTPDRVGVCAAVVYFLVRRQIERALAPKLWLLFALGAAQGLLGWWMVASGLVDIPRVSPYRLTAHLGLAILIYAAMLWVALGLLAPKPPAADAVAVAPAAALRAGGHRTGGLHDSDRRLRGRHACRFCLQRLADHARPVAAARPVRPGAVVDQSF